MPGLLVILVSDGARGAAGLEAALAAAALGRDVAVLLKADALVAAHGAFAGGVAMLAEAGVTLMACQASLAERGVALPPGAEAGGLVGAMSGRGDWQLLLA